MKFLRIILKDEVAEDEINIVAQRNGWVLHKVILSTDISPYEKIWVFSAERISIHYIEDFLINIRYLTLKGENLSIVKSQVCSSLDIYKREEIFSMMEKAAERSQFIHAIYNIGALATQEFDPDIFDLFKDALANRDPEVRRAAIFATGYPAWPEFRELIEYIQFQDPEPTVRAYASLMLASHLRFSWNIYESVS